MLAFQWSSEPVLHSLRELECLIIAETAGLPVNPDSIPFATPSGTLYEADCLTWKFFHCHSAALAYAVNMNGYGVTLSDRLLEALCPPGSVRPVSIHVLKEGLLGIRRRLRESGLSMP